MNQPQPGRATFLAALHARQPIAIQRIVNSAEAAFPSCARTPPDQGQAAYLCHIAVAPSDPAKMPICLKTFFLSPYPQEPGCQFIGWVNFPLMPGFVGPTQGERTYSGVGCIIPQDVAARFALADPPILESATPPPAVRPTTPAPAPQAERAAPSAQAQAT